MLCALLADFGVEKPAKPQRAGGRAKQILPFWTDATSMRHLQFAAWAPFPLPHVFAFFSNPENLPRIMPAETKTRLERIHLVPPPPPSNLSADARAAGVGSRIETSFRPFAFLPLRAQWASRITEFQWNGYFADVQEEGPFKHWRHRHEFQEEIRNGLCGTLVRDGIEYEVGIGVLGAIADALFIARQMRRTFAHRQQILSQLLSRGSAL